MPSDSYPFAVGRIRGLERSLLDQMDLSRIAEQPMAAAVKSLADLGYGQNAKDKSDADSLIAAEMDSLRLIIEEVTPKKELTDLFIIPQDAINFKLLLKARMLGETVGDDELARGLFDAALLKKAVETKKYDGLPLELAEGMRQVEKRIGEKEFAEGVDPLTVSAEVDRVVYGFVFERLRETKNSFVEGYFRAKVDFTNLLSFLRARALRWDKTRLAVVLVGGGRVSESDFLKAYDLPVEGIEKAISFGELGGAVRKGLLAYADGGESIYDAAVVFEESLMDIAAAQRLDSFGIGPVVCYLLKKTEEGKKLRIIFAKKRSGETAERRKVS